MASVQDDIGAVGETVVNLLLSRRHDRPRSLFKPAFLGEKHPSIDFYVELVLPDERSKPFFLAQVKTTSLGYDASGRLRAGITRRSLDALRRYPVPTYVIGVDERREEAFSVAVLDGGPVTLSSVPTTYRLSAPSTIEELHSEVVQFWARSGVRFTESRFAAPSESPSP